MLSTKGLWLRGFLWLVLVGAFIGIGMAGPKSLKRFPSSAYDCDGETETYDPVHCHGVEMNKGGVWKQEITSLTSGNQLLLVDLQAQYAIFNDTISIQEKLLVTTSVWAYDDEDDPLIPIIVNQTHIRELNCDEGVEWCDKIHLLHIAWLEHENYKISVSFENSRPRDLDMIGDVQFELVTVSEQYSEFAIVVKWLYILLTLEVFFLFRRRMSLLRSDQWTTPQTWISALLIALIFFNDPLCILSPLGIQPSWIIPLISLLLQVSFCFLLLLFWLVVLDALHKNPLENEEPDSLSRTVWKYLIVLVIWVLTCILLVWQRSNQVTDPMVTYPSDFPYFVIFRDVTLALAALYFFWIIYLVVESTEGLASYQPDFRRFVCTLILSLIVLAFFVLGSLIGVFPYLAEGDLIQTKGWHFSALYALVNWYCFALAYMFSPSNSDPDTVYDALSYDRTGLFADEL